MSQHQDLLTELETLITQFEAEKDDPAAQRKILARMQLPLIASQDIGDDKIQIVQTLTDTIENKIRQLEHDSQNLDFGRGEEEESPVKSVKKEDKDKSAKKRKVVKEEEEHISNKPSTPNGKKIKSGKSSSNIKASQEKASTSAP